MPIGTSMMPTMSGITRSSRQSRSIHDIHSVCQFTCAQHVGA